MDQQVVPQPCLPADAGTTHARMQDMDWSSFPVGPQAAWPQSLRTTVQILLDSPSPMLLAWGPSLTCFFNDAYAALLDEGRMPEPGMPLAKLWSDAWVLVAPRIAGVLDGTAPPIANLAAMAEKASGSVSALLNVSCSPVRDDRGIIAGILCVASEPAGERVARREAFLLDTADQLRNLADPKDIIAAASQQLGRHLGAARAGYGEVDRLNQTIHVRRDWSASGVPSLAGERYALDSFGAEVIDVLRAGRTLVLDDVTADPRSSAHAAVYAAIGVRSVLAVPLIKWNRLTAILYVHRQYPHGWQASEVRVVQDLAERTWEVVGRARAEEALRASEARYRTLTETISAVVWRANSSGAVVADMPSWSAFTGQSRAQYQGSGWLNAVHPDDIGQIGKAWQEAVRSGAPCKVAYRLRRHDGEFRDMISQGVPIRTSEGDIREWVGSCTDVTDARRSAEILRLAQDRLEAAMIAGEVSTWIWNIPEDCVIGDRNLHRLFGIGGDDGAALPVDRFLAAIHPDDIDRVTETIRSAIDGRQDTFHCEYRVRQASGVARNVLAQGKIERNADGAALRMPGVILDVTARARAEQALRESEERLRQLANTIPQLAWMANPDGWIHWYNDRWYDYTGTTIQDMEGWGWQSVHDPDRLPEIVRTWEASIATGKPFETTFPLRAASGEYRTFFTRAAPLYDSSGNIVQWFGTNTDVTPLQQAEQAVRESEQRLREGLIAARMAVWNWDLASGKVKFVANSDQAFGQSWDSETLGWLSVHPEDRPALRAAIDAAIAERTHYAIAVRMLRPGTQDVFWVEVRGTVESDASAQARSIRGVFIDITERKRAEEALRDADRRKDEFLAMLAHELRNPLAPISMAAQILKTARLDETRLRQTSDIVARQVHHMTQLVDDLLDVSRVTRGLVTLDRTSLEGATVIKDAIEQVRPLIEARRHRLTVRLPQAPEVMRLPGDRTRLVQVVANLLNNAARYTPNDGDIALELTARDQWLEISVSDNGIGISSDLLPHVFDLFAQAKRSPDRSEGGLGLGLALVKSLVELHGGTASADSPGLGQGSRFTVRLPGHKAEFLASPPPTRETAARPAWNAPLQIMIVDDNVDAACSLAILLRAEGHFVAVEHGAHAALERARRDQPGVMILDIGLPDMDGYTLATHLRQLPQAPDSMLIALTGYGQSSDRARSAAAGFNHHLVKPADITQLFRLLADASATQRATLPEASVSKSG